jgi:hypothetical protein
VPIRGTRVNTAYGPTCSSICSSHSTHPHSMVSKDAVATYADLWCLAGDTHMRGPTLNIHLASTCGWTAGVLPPLRGLENGSPDAISMAPVYVYTHAERGQTTHTPMGATSAQTCHMLALLIGPW